MTTRSDTPMSVESRAELVADLRKRAEACLELIKDSTGRLDIVRLYGKASAYAHAADLVEAQP